MTRASELVFQPRAPRCPVLDAACGSRAAAESATFWEGKSVGTLGPAPGDGRPVYAHVYFTGSDVAAQNLEQVVTLRHGSELFNPQSGSRSRAGRPGDWVVGGTGQSSAATVCGDVTDANLPPETQAPFPSAFGTWAWALATTFPRPFLSETQTPPVAVAGGASALAAFALGAGLARRFPTPSPRPPKAASHLEVEDPVALLEGDLEHLQRADVGGQAREALLAAAAHAHQQGVPAGGLQDSVDPADVRHRVLKQHLRRPGTSASARRGLASRAPRPPAPTPQSPAVSTTGRAVRSPRVGVTGGGGPRAGPRPRCPGERHSPSS